MIPGVEPQYLLFIIGAVVMVMLAVFIITAMTIAVVTYEENPVQDRLLKLQQTHAAEVRMMYGAKGPFDDLFEALIKFSGPLSKAYFKQTEAETRKIKSMLLAAGQPETDAHVARLFATKAAVGILLAVVFLLVTMLFVQSVIVLAAAIFGFLVGTMIPTVILRIKGSRRQNEIRFKLPDTLDLMVVCVEAGLGLDATIKRVADETTKLAPEISHEFKRLNRELGAGVPRMEAFQNLGDRSGVDSMKSLCALIIQSDKLGTSIADVLRIYADDLRVKRRQRAEELASKASIKMTVVLVFLVFPAMFIVLLGPMVIQLFQTFVEGGA